MIFNKLYQDCSLYSRAVAPELEAIRKKPNLWFGQYPAIDNQSKQFAIFDKEIIKEIKNNGFTDDPNKFYLEHDKTQELINFILASYNRKFPKLSSGEVYDHLFNQGFLDPDSGVLHPYPIFILIHDLMHQVIDANFISTLKSQWSYDDKTTLLDQLNEDLASSLSGFEPIVGQSSQGVLSYIKEKFISYLTALKQPYNLKKILGAIDRTFHLLKAELRGRGIKYKIRQPHMKRYESEGFSPQQKQFLDGFLSHLKRQMMLKAPNIANEMDQEAWPQDIWKEFNIEDYYPKYYEKVRESKILPQEDSAALLAWLRDCLSKMQETLNYFRNLDDEFYSEEEF